MKRYKTVDEYINASEKYQSELVRLREILNSTKLQEEVKWGGPIYTFEGKNVVGIAGFKNHFGLWFHQGVLLKDDAGVLINCQEGKTKALRQWRMTMKSDIKARLIKAYVKESIEFVENGVSIKPDRKKPIVVPSLLKSCLAKNKKAQSSFKALTVGKQREYTEYIADAKRDETKLKRLEKIIPMIVAGQGLNDKYRNC